jgi:hypothetical protein
MRSEATEASLMFVSSRSLCTRLMTRVRSSLALVRERVRSRASRCHTGGIKLGRSNPCVPQVRNPFRILDIRLASRHGFDMLGVDHQEFQGTRPSR